MIKNLEQPDDPVLKTPDIIDDVRCYAPELALDGGDFPIDAHDRLVQLEEGHFWFQARNRIILQAFRKYLNSGERLRVLEIGCGTGYVLQGLATEGRYHLTGTEIYLSGLRHAQRRLPDVQFAQVDARYLPYRSEFDGIGAFDVIEHIEEDETVLRSIHRALKPNGRVFISVPQHAWLWSTVDEDARHKRRYSRGELRRKLEATGFHLLYATSFVTVLLPVMLATRLAKRQQPANTEAGFSELKLSPIINSICGTAMRVDEALISLGISLPAGGSLLAVAARIHDR